MKLTQTLIFIFLLANSLAGQDNIGIAGSSHAPANTVLINPSSIVDSRVFLDFNLIGIGAFVRNDLVYIPGKQISMKGLSALTEVPVNRKNDPYAAYADVIVQGPSLVFAVKKHSFGFHTAARVSADVRGIPKAMGYYITDGIQYPGAMGVQQQVKNLRANALGWGELGLSYGTILKSDGDAIWQGGITAKRLLGVAGVGLRLDDWSYVVSDSTHLETSVFRGEYGFNDPSASASMINGKGWGFDLGMTYKVRKSNSEGYVPHDPCTDGDYRYKIGFSILDIGRIKFIGPFYRNVFDQSESAQWEEYAGSEADDAAGLDSLFNSNFNLVEQNGNEKKFNMKLPTALSAQFDYNFGHNIYVMGIATIGLPRKNSLGIQRASYIGVVPRFEIKRLEFSMPLSLYEWKNPQMGFAVRANSIIIGSDNLAALLFKKNVYGADIYFNLKYTIFKNWKCKTKKEKPAPIRKKLIKTALPCPDWEK